MTGFCLVAADPPWRFDDELGGARKGKPRRGAAAHYRTMSTEAICALGEELRPSLARDAICVLWFNPAIAADSLRVMDAWGFRQTQLGVWVKLRRPPRKGLYKPTRLDPAIWTGAHLPLAFNLGRVLRSAKEPYWVGVRGNAYGLLGKRNHRDVQFDVQGSRHSEKTEKVQDLFDTLVPRGPRLELFARRARPGWLCLGNESPHSPDEDIVASLARLRAGPLHWPEPWSQAVQARAA